MSRQDAIGTVVGDKVRVRSGSNAEARGLVVEVREREVLVRLDTGEEVSTSIDGITNYSLAARRAWEVMPKRAGRPSQAGPQKKMVSIRIDSEVWELLGKAVDLGLLPSREQAINAWLRQKADELFEPSTMSNTHFAEESNA